MIYYLNVANTLLMIAVVMVITVQDCISSKIKNNLVLLLLLSGFIFSQLTGVSFSKQVQFFGGLCVGFLLFLLVYCAKITSAGDVKYFGALSAILGLDNVLYFFVSTIIFGGVYAFLLIALHGEIVPGLRRIKVGLTHYVANRVLIFEERPKDSILGKKFPYAIAITSGAVLTVINKEPLMFSGYLDFLL